MKIIKVKDKSGRIDIIFYEIPNSKLYIEFSPSTHSTEIITEEDLLEILEKLRDKKEIVEERTTDLKEW